MTLAIPPASAAVEERGETGLPASPSRGTHGSPSWSELEASEGDVAWPEIEHPPAGHGAKEVEIPCPGEAGTRVEPSAVPSSQELAMVWSSAEPSSRLGATHDLVWPYPSNPRKARFVLHDEEEVGL